MTYLINAPKQTELAIAEVQNTKGFLREDNIPIFN